MRKICSFLLALLLLCTLCACGNKTEEPNEEKKQETRTYAFSYNGKEIRPGDDMATVMTIVGKELSYFEAASCAFNGLDKTYTYSGFQITTNPIDGKDIVASILITNDSWTTQEGIYIGSTKASLEEIYGKPSGSTYSYTNGCTIQFVLKDDIVVSIEYV